MSSLDALNTQRNHVQSLKDALNSSEALVSVRKNSGYGFGLGVIATISISDRHTYNRNCKLTNLRKERPAVYNSNKKLSYRRQATRCLVLLSILVSR